jgi:hypothetical protein
MTSEAQIHGLIEEVIAREGGFVDHPADRGGPTRWGVTETVARANGYDGPMRSLPRDVAADIYRRLYWERPRFDAISARAPALAAELFDTGINMGPRSPPASSSARSTRSTAAPPTMPTCASTGRSASRRWPHSMPFSPAVGPWAKRCW